MGFAAMVLALTASCGQTPITEILDYHASHFSAMPHMDLEYATVLEFSMDFPSEGVVPIRREMMIRLRTRGPMYRIDIDSSERKLNTGTIRDSHPITDGFNGERFFIYSPTFNNLTLSNERRGKVTAAVQLPYLLPFAFAAYHSPEDRIAYLRREDSWDTLAELATSQGTEKFGFIDCSVYEFSSPDWVTASGRQEKYKVFFADKLGYFPVVTERYRQSMDPARPLEFDRISRYEFMGLKNVGDSVEPYYIYRRAKGTIHRFGDEQTGTKTITLNDHSAIYGTKITEAQFFEGMDNPDSIHDLDEEERYRIVPSTNSAKN